MGTTPAAFTGNSKFSQDFSNVISRATAIASLPISQLNADKTSLTDQAAALTGLDGTFTALQTSLQGIANALSGSSFQADISDPSKVKVTLGDGAMEGNYTIDVVDAGAYATSMTSSSWAAGTGATRNYQLFLGGVSYALSPADNSAASVAAAINSQYGDKVQATVVNVGSSAQSDYRISLKAAQLGDLQPDILVDSTSVQQQQATGAEAHYIVNNSGQDVSSTTRSVTIANGVTVNLLAKDLGAPVNITVTRSTSALSDALTAFTSAYNAAVDEVDKQHGKTGGRLAGQSVVTALSQTLSGIATYSAPSGQIGGLQSLGVELDKTGHLTFSSFSLLAADITNSTGVTAFLGSATSDGFLKSALDSLNSVENTTSGLLKTTGAAVQSQIADIDNRIADQQTRVDLLTLNLQTKMAAADALISSMEQQYNFISGMFAAMQTAANQYK